jgi:3-methyladenine DNA glycosylase AlkC
MDQQLVKNMQLLKMNLKSLFLNYYKNNKKMAELLKNLFNEKLIHDFSAILSKTANNFDEESFKKAVLNPTWKTLELKERMRHITHAMHVHIEGSFENQSTVILNSIIEMECNGRKEMSIEFMFLPDFIEVYGIDHLETSIKSMEKITQFTSCEFAVRPFILKYPTQMIDQMKTWSKHSHAMVRRLSTEGCRPRLPWAMALPFLKKDPTPILSILEHLKKDVSETVRRSVANNLNDISKDNPDIALQLARQWKGKSAEIDWLVKHACRTLLKEGVTEIMQLFGFGEVDKIKIQHFKVNTPKVRIGDALAFSFQVINTAKTALKLRLEYGLYYQKANGTLAKKVFKISEKMYSENSTTEISRKQSFKIITTRKFHLGAHQVSIIINGQEFPSLNFELVN